jgi:hypothetical protein
METRQMITIKADVNGHAVCKLTAINTGEEMPGADNKMRYIYKIMGWTTNHKKGKQYMIDMNAVIEQHGPVSRFVEDLMNCVGNKVDEIEEEEQQQENE